MSRARGTPGRISPEDDSQAWPLDGGYYWLPSPGEKALAWDIVTCHDLGRDATFGHVELWPAVVGRLALAWGVDERPLFRRLKDQCYGLPRGRVTRPQGGWLLLHGGDSPRPDWLVRVCTRFDLDQRSVKVLFDEHETTFAEHRRAIRDALGLTSATNEELP